MILGAASIQISAALVTKVFDQVGPSATSAFRFLFGAAMLLLATRPKIRTMTKQQWWAVLALGLSVAFMNQCFYQSVARIPLGTAVSIEYLGPFLVSALGKRSFKHLVFVALAALGVVFIAHPSGGANLTGVLFAAGSGLGWAAYVIAAHRVGGQASGFSGLALSMTVGALVTLPMSIGSASVLVAHPALALRIAIVALMSIVVGFSFEMQALRRLKPSTAGVLFALDPATAFVIGLIILSQSISPADLIGMVFVVIAGIGVTLDAASQPAQSA